MRKGVWLVALATALVAPAAAQDELIGATSTWKYLDDGTNQGTAWRMPAFDDSLWDAGPAELGYGDGNEATLVEYGPDPGNKYITTYFRQDFDVVNPASYVSLHV